MSRYIWLIDNGHGGLINGDYQTAGKRFRHPDGLTIYEGETNRRLAATLMYRLTEEKVSFYNISPELTDISLRTRISRANKFYSTAQNCILVSLHGNAGGGNGFEVYTSRGQTKSDKMATVFIKHLEKDIPEFPVRKDFSDNDPDKEAGFYMIRKSKMPAVLTENLFMDNYRNCQFMLSDHGRKRIAAAHLKAIMEIEDKGLDNL